MAEPVRTSIVLVGPALPYRGGIAHFLESMAAGLRGRGHDVAVVTFSRQYPDLLFPGASQYAGEPAEATAAERLIDSINPLSWFRAARNIARKKPDMVVFQYWLPFFAPVFGIIARRLKKRGIRIVSVVHNALPHEKRPGDRLLSRYFLASNDTLLVLSESVERDLDALGISTPRRRVEHPVYDVFGAAVEKTEARRRLNLAQDAPVMLFFGLVRPYKGLQVLLKAMPQVVQQLPNARLVVAGECYGDEAVYRSLAEDYGLSEHVSLRFEYIPDDEIATLFSAADVAVQPYVSATQSGVAKIAFHFERPLIVTDVGGLAEVVPHEKAGLVVPADNPRALASAIVRFFEEKMGEMLSEGVRSARQKYSWDNLLDKLLE